MKFPSLLAICVLFSSCAATPLFRRAEKPSDPGYVVKSSPETDIFEVTLQNLPSNDRVELLSDYLGRAAAEECVSRGYRFADHGPSSFSTDKVFCYKSGKRVSIGIGIDVLDLVKAPPRLVVNELLKDSGTKVQVGDRIVAVTGKPVTTMADIKEILFRHARGGGGKEISVRVERGGKMLDLSTPVAGQDWPGEKEGFLEWYRKLVP